jgi:excisionase family DNA binding protein
MNRLSKVFFNVDEVAELSGLHPKTVQRFIREGCLGGQKIGSAWKIHREDLKEFTHSKLAEDGWNNSSSRAVFSDKDRVSGEGRLSVSAVIELKESAADKFSRISNTIIAVLNSKDPSWKEPGFDFYHDWIPAKPDMF